MGPGGYKFFDYTKVGTPLNITIWLVAVLIIPIFFPFN
jgi:di/tricarboxylate transporter